MWAREGSVTDERAGTFIGGDETGTL
jgi:hypothetical protein